LLEADAIDDPAFNEIRETAGDLATRAEEIEHLAAEESLDPGAAIPEAFQQETIALSQRVCQCYLRAAEIDSAALPESGAEGAAEAVEELAAEQDQLEAETVMWAARAKAIAAERDSAVDALEQIVDKLDELDTERRWSPDWETAVEQEREHRRRKKELDEKLERLQEDLE